MSTQSRTSFDEIRRPVDKILNSPVDDEELDDSDIAVTYWVKQLVEAVLEMIFIIITNLVTRIMVLENNSEFKPPSTTSALPTEAGSIKTPATANTKPPTNAPTNATRCSRCHARGHDIAVCRTSDPSTMRKRVARNNRIAKEQRILRSNSSYLPISPPSASYVSTSPNPSPTNHMEYAALLADATEYRRRQAQSIRDRRTAKRRPPKSS